MSRANRVIVIQIRADTKSDSELDLQNSTDNARLRDLSVYTHSSLKSGLMLSGVDGTKRILRGDVSSANHTNVYRQLF